MSKKINFNDAEKRLIDNVGTEYELIKYNQGKYSESIIRHKICGRTYNCKNVVYFYKKLKGNHAVCPYCNRTNGKYSDEQIQIKINLLLGDDYTLLNYINKRTPIEILHKKCNNKIKLYLGNIQKGQKCQICESGFAKLSKNKTYTFTDFKKVVTEKSYNTVKLINYNTYKTDAKFLCLNCNHEFITKPGNFIRGTRCPYCKATSGEQILISLFDSKNIKYEFQKKIKIDKKVYTFDFYLPEKNQIIEFDGK